LPPHPTLLPAVRLEDAPSLDAARDALLDALEEVDAPTRIETAVPPTPLLAWLRGQSVEQRAYWRDRDREIELAVTGFGAVRDQGQRGLLAGRFDGSAIVMTPLVELRRDQNSHVLSVSVDDVGMLPRARHVLSTLAPPMGDVIVERTDDVDDYPSRSTWDTAVADILETIATGKLSKCVLTRSRVFTFEQRPDPFAIIEALAAQQPAVFHFAFQFAAGNAFLGATPELLFQRRDRNVESEALAGTRPRGADEAEDARLTRELSESVKELHEHAFVSEHVRSALGALCAGDVVTDGPTIRVLPHLLHLNTRVHGQLRPRVGDAHLLAALHPTPAVCGTPVQTARETIRRLEPFERWMFSGPVGWLSPDDSTVAVGIRSARIQGNHVRIYAGAGIVDGSEAQVEWDETAGKMRALDEILRAPHHR